MILSACGENASVTPPDYLIRIGTRVVTRFDFERAFEITKTAYPHNVLQKKEAMKEARLRLLNQLTEELVLQQRAFEIGVKVTETELNAAIDGIKQDYPEGMFQQTLLENAISFESWKNGLKNRLLMEKVIASELEDRISISQDDIAKYYREHVLDENKIKEQNQEDTNALIIKHLRRQKAEQAYKTWIEKLQQSYEIDINWKLWEKIIDS